MVYPLAEQRLAQRTSASLYPQNLQGSDNRGLEQALHALESAALNFALRFIGDSKVRLDYQRQTAALSQRIRREVLAGKITAQQGAKTANSIRNEILKASRFRTSDIGLAFAEAHKKTGLSFDDLLAKYSGKKFGKTFSSLSKAQQNEVFLELVDSAGRNSEKHTKAVARNLRFGRALVVVSITISILNIIAAEDKLKATAKEGTVLGGGFAGGAAGGAAAGLLCGPGAPVCVTVGVVVGGVLGALGADYVFEWLWD
ncbi:hypothetical protein PsAD2_02592 [Pseudovibrio axinellae]|uniref:Uncharacterized protein n=1 Tax=Pseudovibrio axinellae TaxID=989403 RepID=A0A165Y3M7_9HYPH|nr:hypothetical protein [Pseudovibrio axinellae]KZL18408.1 hypothetical protein PsAD2_02592 [Pseudovibrio axinellae]SER89424.1 hypothetical protein SAMN05421798_1533 [Pseudovibrio axinellae]